MRPIRLLATEAFLIFSVSSFGADLVKIETVNRHDPAGVIYTGEKIEDGRVFAVPLTAPGRIVSIEYSCDGGVCPYVHKCPDGGKCVNFLMAGHTVRGYPDAFRIRGSNATFWGWTNSKIAAYPDDKKENGIFTFKIHYVADR
jgi:hypothetical protein